jgi:hypothetical protein
MQYSQQADWFANRFHQELAKPATNALSPIIVATTRGAGITAAAGTRLAHPLFLELFGLKKSPLLRESTPDFFLRLAPIGKVSRLLRPVGPGLLSQNPSPSFLSQGS